MTSMSPPPAPGSFDLETVKVWYSCKSQNQCSSWFYSVPALQKHFTEKHPDEELKLPDNLDPEALEGRIIFELPGCHKNCTKVRVGCAPPPPMQSPALVNKKTCIFCSRSYPSQDILNFHLKKDHHLGCSSAAEVEPISSDEETPQERQLMSQCPPQSNSPKVIKAKPYSRNPLKLPSAQLHPFGCDCCSKTFRSSSHLKRHLLIHSDERLKCSICGFTTRWKANLARHMVRAHNSTSKVSKTTQKHQLIKRTKPRVSKNVIFTCDECPYNTKFAQRFENHCRLHELGADAVACHICGWFMRPSFVGLHQANCHSETVSSEQGAVGFVSKPLRDDEGMENGEGDDDRSTCQQPIVSTTSSATVVRNPDVTTTAGQQEIESSQVEQRVTKITKGEEDDDVDNNCIEDKNPVTTTPASPVGPESPPPSEAQSICSPDVTSQLKITQSPEDETTGTPDPLVPSEPLQVGNQSPQTEAIVSQDVWPFPKRVDKCEDAQWRRKASTPAPAVSTEPQGVSRTATYNLSNIEPSAAGNNKIDQNQPLDSHSEFEQMPTYSIDACVICDDPSEVIGTAPDAPLSEDEANQLMTLCRNMMPNQNDIPKVIRREMFPFCASCKDLAKELWECNIRMEKIKAKIESKAVEEVILSEDPIPSEEANNGKRFMKLRSVIYQGYLNKLRLKKNERLAGKLAANLTRPIISSENNGKPAERIPTDEENSRYQLPLEVEQSVTGESMMNLEVKEESRSGAEEQEFGDPLFEEEHTTIKVEVQPENTDEQVVSLNAQVSVPRTRSGSAKTSEGTLLVEAEEASVKLIWTKDLSTSKAFMECSFENCNHSVPFGTTIEEMNEAYESSKEHIQRNHKDDADRLAKRFGKQQHFQCPLHPTCKLQFADSVSTDKHEIIHRSCGHCGKKIGKIAFYKNPSLMLSHKCLQNNAEKRNESADHGPSRQLRNKRFKYVP